VDLLQLVTHRHFSIPLVCMTAATAGVCAGLGMNPERLVHRRDAPRQRQQPLPSLRDSTRVMTGLRTGVMNWLSYVQRKH